MLAVAILNALPEEEETLEDSLRRYLSEHTLRMEVHAYAHAKDFWEARQQRYFELILLMVRQGEEEGIQLARKLRERDKETLLIFVSPDTQWAVESYRVRAHDYLLWPFQYTQFEGMMNLCAQTLRRRRPFIEIKEGRLSTRVLLEDIYYTDYHNHYIQLHLRDRVIRTYMAFPAFLELMSSHPRFLCCYRNVLVNMDHVVAVDEHDFLLEDGSRVPVSRNGRRLILQRYQDYQFEKQERRGCVG